jgi:hypothetical protein
MVGLRTPLVVHPLQAFVTEPLKPWLDHIIVSASLHVYVSQSSRGELITGGALDPYELISQRSTLDFAEGLCGFVGRPCVGGQPRRVVADDFDRRRQPAASIGRVPGRHGAGEDDRLRRGRADAARSDRRACRRHRRQREVARMIRTRRSHPVVCAWRRRPPVRPAPMLHERGDYNRQTGWEQSPGRSGQADRESLEHRAASTLSRRRPRSTPRRRANSSGGRGRPCPHGARSAPDDADVSEVGERRIA